MIEMANGINRKAGELGWRPGHSGNSHGHAIGSVWGHQILCELL